MFRVLDPSTKRLRIVPGIAALQDRQVAKQRQLASAAAKCRLLIVGHGMVSQHLCKELARLGLTDTHEITVLSEEPTVAYDRVNLTKVLKGAERESIALTDPSWFEKVGIELKLNEPVVSLDRESRLLRTINGVYGYDKLVFATGSRPFVPKVEGLNLPQVLVYRTLEDAVTIRQRAERCSRAKLPAVVIGAGLLGVEAAEAVKSLGCDVELIESAAHLLSRQLDDNAAKHLERALLDAGFTLHTGARLQKVTAEGEVLSVHLEDGKCIPTGLVIVATGVKPRDEIAKEAGVSCDLFGGIIVDDTLTTSDPTIFAVGECARHRGLAYGVVAPGYLMADTFAARLAGKKQRFHGTQITTRLKIPHVELTCVGESNVRDLATRCTEREDDGRLQQLVLRKGRIVGATAIGAWPDLPKVQQAISTGQKVRSRHIERFQSTGTLWPNQTVNLAVWPDAATVCGCTGATCGVLRQAKAGGCETPRELTDATGAGSVCGSCVPLLESMCGLQTEAPSHRLLVSASAVGLLLVGYALFGPSIPFSETVQTIPWDVLWRDSTIKQISGFSLLGVALMASTLSVRKRIAKFTWGSFAGWRGWHSVLGVSCLLGIAVHTGFRLGNNLDAALGISFLLMTLVGGIAGIATAVERRLPDGRGVVLRKWSGRLHLWLLWPLPVLVLFHVLKVYFF